jgi:phosphoribosylformylglycinamidine (FGAM) synthase PurS component
MAFVYDMKEDGTTKQVYFPVIGLNALVNETGKSIIDTLISTYKIPSVTNLVEPGQYRVTRDGVKKTMSLSIGEAVSEVEINVSQKDIAKVLKFVGEKLETYSFKSIDNAIQKMDSKLVENSGVESSTLFHVWTIISKLDNLIV